jgi:hypothetical protein
MLKQVIEVTELLDSAEVCGRDVADLLRAKGLEKAEVERVEGESGSTDFVKVTVPGARGRLSGGKAPTLGILGRLGGIGARPERVGIVSDADGAVVAIACALKLVEMRAKGDRLDGDIVLATHVCPNAPTQPHEPVPFMGSPVDIATMNRHEVDPAMDAILSVDTTKGNRIINHRGFAITPTIKDGYILRVSEDLLDIMQWSTGRLPFVVPVTTQDITPYGNGVFHINSLLQPSVVTDSPVVGVAITAETPVPGCGTGASRETDIEEAARYCLEVAKAYGAGACRFYDPEEFDRLTRLYGSLSHLRTQGRGSK